LVVKRHWSHAVTDCKKNRKSAVASGLPSGQICEGSGFLLLLPLEEKGEEVSGSTFERIGKR
jgi:hypothetical protein